MRKKNCKWVAVLLGCVFIAGCCGAGEKENAKQQSPEGLLEISEITFVCACPCDCCKKCPKCQKSPCKKTPCPEKKNCPVTGRQGNCPVKAESKSAEKAPAAQQTK